MKKIIKIAKEAKEKNELTQREIQNIKDNWSEILQNSKGKRTGNSEELLNSLKPLLKKEITIKQGTTPMSQCFLIINALEPFNNQ